MSIYAHYHVSGGRVFHSTTLSRSQLPVCCILKYVIASLYIYYIMPTKWQVVRANTFDIDFLMYYFLYYY